MITNVRILPKRRKTSVIASLSLFDYFTAEGLEIHSIKIP